MNVYDKIEKSLQKKENGILSLDDTKKCEFIHKLLEHKELFFNIDIDVIKGIFVFLGFKNDETIELFKDLYSFDNFKKSLPEQRIIIDNKNK